MQFSENLDWNSCHLPSTHEDPKLVLAYSPYLIKNRQCVRYFGAPKLPVPGLIKLEVFHKIVNFHRQTLPRHRALFLSR